MAPKRTIMAKAGRKDEGKILSADRESN